MSSPTPKVYIIGVGMTPFTRPGQDLSIDYPQLVGRAATAALSDARITYDQVELAVAGYVFGDSCCGQRALYPLGMTGIPIINVNNNCSTGSTALYTARQMILTGQYECTLAVGFEKMERGALGAKFKDRTSPLDKHVELLIELQGIAPAAITAQLFGAAGKEHMKLYGTRAEHFAKIALKNHRHSLNNPYAQVAPAKEDIELNDILDSPKVFDFLTRRQCCPTSDGAACAILASEAFVRRHGLEAQSVEILALEMATDLPGTFQDKSAMKLIGYDMAKTAADRAYAKAKLTAADVDVIELHDCFSCNELVTYEALGLCPPGQAGQLVDKGDNTYGGKYVVNPSGGLIAKGHPLGATGVAQCAELCWQLRGLAGKRQVPNAKVALQHNIGLAGAAVVGLYRRMNVDSKTNKSKRNKYTFNLISKL